jgi:uncharacterized membrane protein
MNILEEMKTRSNTADLLKGIAVLLMIQVHILELFANHSILTSKVGKILMFLGGPPVAPVFALILGYYIASTQKTSGQLLIRAIKIIFLGMLLNVGLNLNLIISVYKGSYKIDLLPYILGIDILQFAGLSIIIIVLLKKILEKNMIITILCVIVSAFLGRFLLNYIPERVVFKYITSPFFGSCSWSYFPLFPWLTYPLAGFAFFQLKKRLDLNILNKPKIKILSGFLFVLLLIFTLRKVVFISSDLTLYYHHGLLFALWVIAFLAFYSFFVFEIDKIIGDTILFRYIKWLGKNVTLVYVIQWIITGNTATEIYKTVSSPLYLVFAFVIVLLISSVLAYLILKFPAKKTTAS